jgi:cephalosporin hydroxylase
VRSTNATSNWLWKKYVTHLQGYSTDPALLAKVQQAADAVRGQPVLVILDSDHTSGHVEREAQLYCPFATQGSYCIVEDTKISRCAGGHGRGRACNCRACPTCCLLATAPGLVKSSPAAPMLELQVAAPS